MSGAPPPPPLPAADRPPAPSLVETAGQIMSRQIVSAVRSRRLLAAALLAALAPVLAWVIRDPDPVILVRLVAVFILPFLLPLVAISLGSGLLYDEAEEGTLTYLFTTPSSKAALVLGKWSAALAAGWAVVLVSLGATLMLTHVDTAACRPFLRACWLAVLLGYPAYLGMFVLLGTLFRRGFLAGLIYAFAYELVLTFIPGAAKRLSLGHFIRSLAQPAAPDREPFEDTFIGLSPETETTCIAVLLCAAVLSIAVALVIVPRKEFQARNVQG